MTATSHRRIEWRIDKAMAWYCRTRRAPKAIGYGGRVNIYETLWRCVRSDEHAQARQAFHRWRP